VPNLAAQVSEMLPTPDSTHGRKDTRTSRLLPGTVDDLLPTPKTPTGGTESTESRRMRGNNHGTMLEAAIQDSLGEVTPGLSPDGSE